MIASGVAHGIHGRHGTWSGVSASLPLHKAKGSSICSASQRPHSTIAEGMGRDSGNEMSVAFPKVAVVGAGAVGIYYGVRLALRR